MTPGGQLPDYLLIANSSGDASEYPQGCWHLTDRHGALLMNVSNPDTLEAMLRDAGAKFQVINPERRLICTAPQCPPT